MDIWKKYKSPLGYETGNNGIDSYGVNHSGFSLRDEIEYQTARADRENKLIQDYNNQGITENYPQVGTSFWGNPENNYGFGSSNITSAISTHPAMNITPMPLQTQNNNIQQLTMSAGSEQQITMPKPQQPSTWDKFKNWAENTGDAMQAGAVGYATGATLGNFDEAMGATAATLTANPNNYTMGRDAVRQLQSDLSQRHPYIYGGAELLGAAQSPLHFVKDKTFANRTLNAMTDTLNASAGYAENLDDFGTNLVTNSIANGIGLASEYLPGGRVLGVIGRKVLTQGVNYLTNKAKEELYKKGK